MAHMPTEGHGTYLYVSLDPTSAGTIASSKTRIPGLEDIEILNSTRQIFKGARQEDNSSKDITSKLKESPVSKFKSTFDPNDAVQDVHTGMMYLYNNNIMTQFWLDSPNADFPVIGSGTLESCMITGPTAGLMDFDFGICWYGPKIVDGVVVP